MKNDILFYIIFLTILLTPCICTGRCLIFSKGFGIPGTSTVIDKRDIQILRDENRNLFSLERYARLIEIVGSNYSYNRDLLYALNFIPEQGEDIYIAVINGKTVLEIEIDRSNNEYCITECDIDSYAKAHGSKFIRRRIAAIKNITGNTKKEVN